MKEVDALLSDIYLKIRKLIETQNSLKAENAGLKESQKELKNLITQQATKIRVLEAKLDQYAVSQTLEYTDIDLARKKIGGLVREIDKCISLLNK
ncbi:MAG TPA: hypothetical protein PK711_03505 [Bacteroidales bacterium]|nr:hypothetical protein [Bacteroidales bacterium]HRZ21575.1 hypothetical protein [Bacteroidales bacterium]